MKYYLASDGAVWAFELDGSQNHLIGADMQPMTDDEIDKHLNPPPTYEQLAYVESEWRATQMPIARENVIAIEFGDESIPGTAVDWKAYWLALRSWVDGAEGYPDSANRPVSPK